LIYFVLKGSSYVTNDDLIAMALGESGVTAVNTDQVTSTIATVRQGKCVAFSCFRIFGPYNP
jgi:hypothetical protein